MKHQISSFTSQRRRETLPKRVYLLASAAIVLSLAFCQGAFAQSVPTYQEPYRPQFHYTPAKNWINDPNGLVDYKGEHHMFQQYNPFGLVAGNQSWGHAVSIDWVHWKELPVAIPATATILIFSGSAVVDAGNSSSFGTPVNPPLVAIYCANYIAASTDPKDGSVIPAGTQAENIAFSTDRGRTWTQYANNPVLNPLKDPTIDPNNFRDPKVFWYEPSQQWSWSLHSRHNI